MKSFILRLGNIFAFALTVASFAQAETVKLNIEFLTLNCDFVNRTERACEDDPKVQDGPVEFNLIQEKFKECLYSTGTWKNSALGIHQTKYDAFVRINKMECPNKNVEWDIVGVLNENTKQGSNLNIFIASPTDFNKFTITTPITRFESKTGAVGYLKISPTKM